MARGRGFIRRKRSRRRQPQEEEQAVHRPVGPSTPQAKVIQLQPQVGNRAVQRMLAQRQVGEIKIERPKIEYYDVTGASLLDVSRQLPKGGEWYEYEYDYDVKAKKGLVTQVDVTVTPTLRLPRWRGPGWEQAPDAEKAEWLRMLGSLEIDPHETFETETKLPAHWLGIEDWEEAPDPLKGERYNMLQTLQRQEEGYFDTIHRRALVLQQLMINQPQSEVKAIFDQFMKGMKVEQEQYGRQEEFGKRKKVSLGTSAMVR